MTKFTDAISDSKLEKYNGWEVKTLSNRWTKVYVAPQLGGRISQIILGEYPYLFANKRLAGLDPGNGRELHAPTKGWLNFGGEKAWPAPQGWNSSNEWPGPPDPILDSGPYFVLSEPEQENQICMVSMEDPYTGLQVQKQVTLSPNSPELIVNTTFLNISSETRCWSIWPVIQFDASGYESDSRYEVVCPINPESSFDGSFKVMHGLANSPQYSINRHGLFSMTYQYLVGKVGLDSNGTWVAFCDKLAGKVFVAEYVFQEGLEYPEGSPVQIWTQGRGMIFSRGEITNFPDDEMINPPYLEVELLSPLHEITPGSRVNFEYKIKMCTIPSGYGIIDVKKTGVVASPLILEREDNLLRVSGRYGVFREGVAKLSFLERDSASESFPEGDFTFSASPLKELILEEIIAIEQFKHIPAIRVVLSVYDPETGGWLVLDKSEICII